MLKITGYWSAPRPEDVEAFEDEYVNHHMPLSVKVPGMTELRTILVEEGMEGSDPIHYRLGEQVWPDRESYEACMRSSEYAAMREHGKMLCEKYGVTVTAEFGDPVDWDLEN